MSTFTLDGKRLTDAEWLKMLADEEHAALEEQFYAFYPSPSSVPVSSQAQEKEGEGSRFEVEAASLDDDQNWPAARFTELVARVARVHEEFEPLSILGVRQAGA